MRDSTAVLHSPFAGGTRLGGFDPARLLAPAQAVVLYLGRAELRPPSVETVALDDALGRVLACDAVAREDHPSHARSTMDGFAVASASVATRRRIVGSVAMGSRAPQPLEPGDAMRVPTGGALPDGADAVVPQEDVALDGETIVLAGPIAAGDSVSQRASDIAAGTVVLRAGRRIGGPELGVLATLGLARVTVYRRPRIGIVSTGDELIDPGGVLEIGRIRDSNRYAIAGALRALGADAVQLPRARDDAAALQAALEHALATCDALVTTGGSSVGERDLLPHVVARLGNPGTLVHGLRVKPGKPTLLAAVDGRAIVGLPGNPASSLMILEAVVRPIVAALTGERDARALALEAVATAPFAGRPGWTHFVPARLALRGALLTAEPLTIRSAQTSLLARASGYARIGEAATRIEAGERVAIALFAAGGAPIEAG
ncbi:MAG: molybdopterin molybdotransferase MoeA [Vulcanimicrobiaceae bacterium]